jgi:disulfide bond formation protein DsbB
MSTMTLATPVGEVSPGRIAIAVAAAAAATIGGALFIEHVLGVKPCELCLLQRIPYYTGVPVAVVAAVVATRRPTGAATAALLALVGLVFLVGSGMGVYHAGVEWGLWQGPTGCTGPIAKPAAMGDFLKQLSTTKVIRCDEVAFRVFGLSLAAWNAVLALGFAALAFAGARLAWGGRS